MVEAQAQAKQLDSVTDVVQETEVDATKAQEAMAGLTTAPVIHNDDGEAATTDAKSSKATVEKTIRVNDVELICNELDVTEEVARKALREAAFELGNSSTGEGQPQHQRAMLAHALKNLVTS